MSLLEQVSGRIEHKEPRRDREQPQKFHGDFLLEVLKMSCYCVRDCSGKPTAVEKMLKQVQHDIIGEDLKRKARPRRDHSLKEIRRTGKRPKIKKPFRVYRKAFRRL